MSADAMLAALLGSKHKVSMDLRSNLKQVKKELKEEVGASLHRADTDVKVQAANQPLTSRPKSIVTLASVILFSAPFGEANGRLEKERRRQGWHGWQEEDV